jgi:hypothetical protein
MVSPHEKLLQLADAAPSGAGVLCLAAPVARARLESICGHHAILTDTAALRPPFADCLEGPDR